MTARDVVAQLLDQEFDTEPESWYATAHFGLRAVEYALDLTPVPAPLLDEDAWYSLASRLVREWSTDEWPEWPCGAWFTEWIERFLGIDLSGPVLPSSRPKVRFTIPSSPAIIDAIDGWFGEPFNDMDSTTWWVQRVVGTYEVRDPGITAVVDRFITAEANRRFGAAQWRPETFPWVEINSDGAHAALVVLQRCSFAGTAWWYPGPIEAQRRADLFVDCFDPAARFFTNLTDDPLEYTQAFLGSVGFEISNAWRDAGVVAVDSRHIGWEWLAQASP
ncbi:hypothetical protein [Actinomadura sp. HBU206391]|uniref:hypothetical protein n=1 Tax=Actinomadura sp. HBU206391 TaxID=2731692 RepID=UPI00164F2A4E|nr:hypothetical protein [Actinomadura sp. HBU206391]MBC6458131.1 hypothetical protein [Actinomadura sp. HBU206391]